MTVTPTRRERAYRPFGTRVLLLAYPALTSLLENASYAPLGLSHFPLAPRASALGCILAPLRGWDDSLATCGSEFEFSHRLSRAGLMKFRRRWRRD